MTIPISIPISIPIPRATARLVAQAQCPRGQGLDTFIAKLQGQGYQIGAVDRDRRLVTILGHPAVNL